MSCGRLCGSGGQGRWAGNVNAVRVVMQRMMVVGVIVMVMGSEAVGM